MAIHCVLLTKENLRIVQNFLSEFKDKYDCMQTFDMVRSMISAWQSANFTDGDEPTMPTKDELEQFIQSQLGKEKQSSVVSVQETKKLKSNPFNISEVNEDKRKQYAKDSGITIKSIESPTSKDLEDYLFTEITIVTANGNRIQVAPQAGFLDLNKESKTTGIKGLIGINYLLEHYLLTHPPEVNKFGGSVLSSYAKDVYEDKYDASKDNFQGDYTAYIKALTSSPVQDSNNLLKNINNVDKSLVDIEQHDKPWKSDLTKSNKTLRV